MSAVAEGADAVPTTDHVLLDRLRDMLDLDVADTTTLTRIVGDVIVLRWEAGEPIAHAGEQPVGLYLVTAGAVAATGEDGESELVPGDAFGGSESLAGSQLEKGYVAKLPSELAIIPSGALRALIEADPRLGDRLRKS